MAEEDDGAERTEEPTQRKIDQARERGQTASTKELGHLLLIGTGALMCVTAGPWGTDRIAKALRAYLADAARMTIDMGGLGHAILGLGQEIGISLAPMALAFIVAAVAGPFLQNAVVVSTEPMKPKLSKISPFAGAKRLFSTHSLIELLKNMLKLVLVSAVAAMVLWPRRAELLGLSELGAGALAGYIVDLSVKLMVAVAALMLVMAALDWIWQRHHWLSELRMSRQDIKEEHRESEGDPMIKGRLRALRMERARRRMMAEVPKATVIITNPTHYAVALRYEHGMPAPEVLAKGTDLVALKIREIGQAHQIPIVENPPLARALFKAVEPGQSIPVAYYQAVAEIISWVMQLPGRRKN